jgi:hypothetical protein
MPSIDDENENENENMIAQELNEDDDEQSLVGFESECESESDQDSISLASWSGQVLASRRHNGNGDGVGVNVRQIVQVNWESDTASDESNNSLQKELQNAKMTSVTDDSQGSVGTGANSLHTPNANPHSCQSASHSHCTGSRSSRSRSLGSRQQEGETPVRGKRVTAHNHRDLNTSSSTGGSLHSDRSVGDLLYSLNGLRAAANTATANTLDVDDAATLDVDEDATSLDDDSNIHNSHKPLNFKLSPRREPLFLSPIDRSGTTATPTATETNVKHGIVISTKTQILSNANVNANVNVNVKQQSHSQFITNPKLTLPPQLQSQKKSFSSTLLPSISPIKQQHTHMTQPGLVRMKILLLSPTHRKFELIKLKCHEDTSVQTILEDLIPQYTYDTLFQTTQTYRGLCRAEMISSSDGSDDGNANHKHHHRTAAASSGGSDDHNTSPKGTCVVEEFVNTFPIQVYSVKSKHMLIAIPSDETSSSAVVDNTQHNGGYGRRGDHNMVQNYSWSAGEIADMGTAILQHTKKQGKSGKGGRSKSKGPSTPKKQKGKNGNGYHMNIKVTRGGGNRASLSKKEKALLQVGGKHALDQTHTTNNTRANTLRMTAARLAKMLIKVVVAVFALTALVALVAEDARLRRPLHAGDSMALGEIKTKCGIRMRLLPTKVQVGMDTVSYCHAPASLEMTQDGALVYYDHDHHEQEVDSIDSSIDSHLQHADVVWELHPSKKSRVGRNHVDHAVTAEAALTVDDQGKVWIHGSPAKLKIVNYAKFAARTSTSLLSPWPFATPPVDLL